jgi:hypothetical protein
MQNTRFGVASRRSPYRLGSRADRLKCHRSARILTADHAFVQNLRRGHYEIATEASGGHRLRTAFDDLALTI